MRSDFIPTPKAWTIAGRATLGLLPMAPACMDPARVISKPDTCFPFTIATRPVLALTLGFGLFSAAVTWSHDAHAEGGGFGSPADSAVHTSPAQLRIGFERTELPNKESMGLVGTSYLIRLGHGFAFGPAAYGAITGERGGLFTVGGELAWRARLLGPLEVDAGYYAGGGGGGSAPVGSGLMLRPHVDLMWNFGRYRAGLSASRVRFADGRIDSEQLGVVFSANTDFSFIGERADGTLPSLQGASGMGFDRVKIVGGAYFPPDGTARLTGAAMGSRLAYVGARFERFLDRDHATPAFAPYWGIEAAGAAGGGVAGYMEYLATLGAETSPWGSRTNFGARAAVGMGGGGEVSVGGGLLVKGSVYATLNVTPGVGLSVEAGVAKAPDGEFRARFAALNLNWTLDAPAAPGSDATIGPAARTEWVSGIGSYRAARRDGSTRSLRNVVLKVNRFVGEHWYLTGQAHSAYAGEAGGYSVGLLGAGYESPQWERWRLGAEWLAGAAGGGGVETGGGALMQPMAYVSREIAGSLSARIGVGRIRSTGGKLSSGVVEVLLAFPFGVSSQ